MYTELMRFYCLFKKCEIPVIMAGHIFLNLKNNFQLFKVNSVCNNKTISSNRKIANS